MPDPFTLEVCMTGIVLLVAIVMFIFFGYLICACVSVLSKLDRVPRATRGITKRMELQLAIAVACEIEALYRAGLQFTVRLGTMMIWLMYVTFFVHLR
ncbi:hypothetical protein K8942_01795 [Candidatus Peribacteria bacterium]|nr:MAG: hypothetical protein K8942_01795 [Candidatus Peribacteria bacterium]